MSHTFLQVDVVLDLKLLLADIRNLKSHLTKVVRNAFQINVSFFEEGGEVYD